MFLGATYVYISFLCVANLMIRDTTMYKNVFRERLKVAIDVDFCIFSRSNLPWREGRPMKAHVGRS